MKEIAGFAHNQKATEKKRLRNKFLGTVSSVSGLTSS